MSYFKAKMHQIRFPLGLSPRPRWELTALPQTTSQRSKLIAELIDSRYNCSIGDGISAYVEYVLLALYDVSSLVSLPHA